MGSRGDINVILTPNCSLVGHLGDKLMVIIIGHMVHLVPIEKLFLTHLMHMSH